MTTKTGIKTGGRQKGTPNKRTQELLDKLRELNFDPLENLVVIANDETTSTELKVKIDIELLNYVYPKRKAIAMDITKYIGDINEKPKNDENK
jgi:hypothetical protein